MTGDEYLLVCLMEECSEIQKAASKALRFGPNGYWDAENGTNREAIARELDDLAGVVELLYDRKLLRLQDILGVAGKKLKIKEFMLVSRKLGRIEAIPTSQPGPITVPGVIAAVERFYHIEPGRLSSRSRVRTLLGPRQVAMYLCRKNTIASYAEIGRAFKRDHPSVVNAFQKISETKDLQLIQHVLEIQREFDSIPCEGS